MKNLFSPYSLSNVFKFLALVGVGFINFYVKHWSVAIASVFILGTFIASEAFVLMLARSMFKNPTDENVVKLFIVLLFKDREQAGTILEDYKREKELKNGIQR